MSFVTCNSNAYIDYMIFNNTDLTDICVDNITHNNLGGYFMHIAVQGILQMLMSLALLNVRSSQFNIPLLSRRA